MAAGVHAARVLRRIGKTRLLLDRQAVDIAAQRDERRLTCANLGDKARLERQVEDLDASSREVLSEALCRLDFLIGEFRVAVEPVKFIGYLLEDVLFVHIYPSLSIYIVN